MFPRLKTTLLQTKSKILLIASFLYVEALDDIRSESYIWILRYYFAVMYYTFYFTVRSLTLKY